MKMSYEHLGSWATTLTWSHVHVQISYMYKKNIKKNITYGPTQEAQSLGYCCIEKSF